MYAILRTKKLKSKSHLTRACEHNLRLRHQNNIDDGRSHLNRILLNSLGIDTADATSFQKKLEQHYAELGIKEKQENILAFEYVATASPKFFNGKSNEDIERWAKHQTDFIQTEFGEQLKFAILHLDEKTPHLHFFISTEIKSVKKYRNRHGECHKTTWSLNSEKINPEYLSDLQTRFSKHNKIFGLRRGVKGSKRKNTPLKQFYRMADKAIESNYQNQIDELISGVELSMGERFNMNTIREKIREKLSPSLNNFFKQQKALKELLKLDLQKLQKTLISDEEKLKHDKEYVASIRELYSEAINSRMKDIQVTEMLAEMNSLLSDEITRLKQKYEPDAVDTGNAGIRFKKK